MLMSLQADSLPFVDCICVMHMHVWRLQRAACLTVNRLLVMHFSGMACPLPASHQVGPALPSHSMGSACAAAASSEGCTKRGQSLPQA